MGAISEQLLTATLTELHELATSVVIAIKHGLTESDGSESRKTTANYYRLECFQRAVTPTTTVCLLTS